MTDIEATIARVLDLDEKATPGPWKWDEDCWALDAPSLPDFIAKKVVPKENGPMLAYYRTAAPELARECRKHIVERTYFVSKMCDLLGIPDSDNESGVYVAANKLRELRQRIIDAACLRDDVSDDDLVEQITLLAARDNLGTQKRIPVVGDVVTVDRPEAHWSGSRLDRRWRVSGIDGHDGSLELDDMNGGMTKLQRNHVTVEEK